jgi:hypothetical protein
MTGSTNTIATATISSAATGIGYHLSVKANRHASIDEKTKHRTQASADNELVAHANVPIEICPACLQAIRSKPMHS